MGRFLYDLKITRVPANAKKEQGTWPHVVDSRGKQVWDLTKHIGDGSKTFTKPTEAVKPTKKEPSFEDKMKSAKKAVGDKFYTDCLNGYQYNNAKEVKEKDQEAILGDLRKQHEKVKESQSERG